MCRLARRVCAYVDVDVDLDFELVDLVSEERQASEVMRVRMVRERISGRNERDTQCDG